MQNEDLEGFIRRLLGKGIALWAEGDALRYRAPKGALTAEERQTLLRANGAIVSLLERDSSATVGSSSYRLSGVRRAPLAFTQLGHWYERLEYGSRPIRNISSVASMRGPLNAELLTESLAAIGRRHDALRTRIVIEDGKPPLQEVADRYRSELEVVRLSSIPKSRRPAEIERQIQRAILEAADYSGSTLFKSVLLLIDESEHMLILALDHMISDLVSLNLLFGEALTVYAQLLHGHRAALPPIAIQFPDYSARQRAGFNERQWSPQRRFSSVARTRFPGSADLRPSEFGLGWGAIRFIIGREFRSELGDWARRHGTTIVIATLTAYAAAVMRFCEVEETVIPFVIDGRLGSELERTIGFFAFPIYIRVALSARSTFTDLLEQVTEEYCRAYDEADFGCALGQLSRPQFTRNPGFNWLPVRASGDTPDRGYPLALNWSPVEFTNPLDQTNRLDAEPSVSFVEEDGTIIGRVHYPLDRFSKDAIEKFAAKITALLGTLIRAPSLSVMALH